MLCHYPSKECDPVDGNNECVIMKTVVTVFLDDEESPEKMRDLILDGFNAAIDNGSLLGLLWN